MAPPRAKSVTRYEEAEEAEERARLMLSEVNAQREAFNKSIRSRSKGRHDTRDSQRDSGDPAPCLRRNGRTRNMSRDRPILTADVQMQEFEVSESDGQHLSADEALAAARQRAQVGKADVPRSSGGGSGSQGSQTGVIGSGASRPNENDNESARGRKGCPLPSAVFAATVGEVGTLKCRRCLKDILEEQICCGHCGLPTRGPMGSESGSEYSESGQSSYGGSSKGSARSGRASHPKEPRMRCNNCAYEFRTNMKYCSSCGSDRLVPCKWTPGSSGHVSSGGSGSAMPPLTEEGDVAMEPVGASGAGPAVGGHSGVSNANGTQGAAVPSTPPVNGGVRSASGTQDQLPIHEEQKVIEGVPVLNGVGDPATASQTHVKVAPLFVSGSGASSSNGGPGAANPSGNSIGWVCRDDARTDRSVRSGKGRRAEDTSLFHIWFQNR